MDAALHQEQSDLGPYCLQLYQWMSKQMTVVILCALVIECMLQGILLAVMVNILKFQTLVVRQKSLDKQRRPRSDCF